MPIVQEVIDTAYILASVLRQRDRIVVEAIGSRKWYHVEQVLRSRRELALRNTIARVRLACKGIPDGDRGRGKVALAFGGRWSLGAQAAGGGANPELLKPAE